jgi:hypothetical protein
VSVAELERNCPTVAAKAPDSLRGPLVVMLGREVEQRPASIGEREFDAHVGLDRHIGLRRNGQP